MCDHTRPMLRSCVLAILCGLCPPALVQGDDWVPPPISQVRLASGRVVDYAIHFDRNSLDDSVRVRDGLIALTSSGALLRFALPGFRLIRERVDDEITCIGRGEGNAVLAGLADGRICRVNQATLELNDVVKLPGNPQWFGWYAARANQPAGMIVATREMKPVVRDDKQWTESFSMIRDLVTGKSFALDFVATAFLCDRAGRFWAGADRGEWGGLITRIDLNRGRVAVINPPPARKAGAPALWPGVYGFIELRDGQVWAYGGTSHFGFNEGEITRVDEGEARTVAAFEPPPKIDQEPDPGRPSMPITHIIEEINGLLVFSYSDVFRVDKALKNWNKIATLELEYHWGRPDAMGAYPAVRVIHPPSRDGEPYLLGTIGDGYVVFDGKKATAHSIRGQLGAHDVFFKMVNTSEGLLTFEDGEQPPNWILGANGWEIVTIAPPLKRDRGGIPAALEDNEETWNETHVLVGPGGLINTVSATAASPDIRTTARWVGRKAVPLAHETSTLIAASSFITADGVLWNAAYYGLRRFQNGRWVTVEVLPPGDFPRGPIAPLNVNGPPWLLLDRFREKLWRLDHGATGENARLRRVQIKSDAKPLVIHDGLPWSDGSLLLATDQGLRVYAPSSQKLPNTDLPEPPQAATALVRDGRGRIWLLAGERLWLSERGARAPETFERVPWIGQGKVSAIAADPQHADGVIVALGSRGVVSVRARQTP